MNFYNCCIICGEEAKFGQQSIIITEAHLGKRPVHKWCYDELKARESGTNVV